MKRTSKGSRLGFAHESGGRHVSDFNTLNDLLEHARGEGATHYLQIDDETHLYFKRRDGRYEKSEAWQKDGYWHTQAPGSRAVVARPPSGARPIGANVTRLVRDYEAVDPRDRVIAGPFKSYGDARNAAGPADHVRFVPAKRSPPRASEAHESFGNSLYDWELVPEPPSMKHRRREPVHETRSAHNPIVGRGARRR